MAIKIVSQEEADKADCCVCALKSEDPGAFTDNKTGTCKSCGAEVIFRPYIRETMPKICVQCAGKAQWP